jgi:hypothetical protein
MNAAAKSIQTTAKYVVQNLPSNQCVCTVPAAMPKMSSDN